MENKRIKLLDTQEGFQKLGIDKNHPADWENAIRLQLPLNPGEYEWWYSDSHFNNGYYCMAQVIIIADENGNFAPLISLNIAKDGEKLCDQFMPFSPDQFQASDKKCDVQVGKSFFKSVEDDLKKFHVYIAPEENNGFGADLILERTVPSYRPGTGRWENEEGHFSWFCTLPGGMSSGKLFVQEEEIEVEGTAYHDHNWGDVPMAQFVDNWLWGRATIDGVSVVATSLRFRSDRGGLETPMLFVTKGTEVLVDAYGEHATCLEGVKKPHPETGKLISSDCIYLLENAQEFVRFQGKGTAVASFQLPAASSGWETWYARYNANVSMHLETKEGKVEVSGVGTLEVMDFFGRQKLD